MNIFTSVFSIKAWMINPFEGFSIFKDLPCWETLHQLPCPVPVPDMQARRRYGGTAEELPFVLHALKPGSKCRTLLQSRQVLRLRESSARLQTTLECLQTSIKFALRTRSWINMMWAHCNGSSLIRKNVLIALNSDRATACGFMNYETATSSIIALPIPAPARSGPGPRHSIHAERRIV